MAALNVSDLLQKVAATLIGEAAKRAKAQVIRQIALRMKQGLPVTVGQQNIARQASGALKKGKLPQYLQHGGAVAPGPSLAQIPQPPKLPGV